MNKTILEINGSHRRSKYRVFSTQFKDFFFNFSEDQSKGLVYGGKYSITKWQPQPILMLNTCNIKHCSWSNAVLLVLICFYMQLCVLAPKFSLLKVLQRIWRRIIVILLSFCKCFAMEYFFIPGDYDISLFVIRESNFLSV